MSQHLDRPARPTPGKVWLVGAGPGAADLITVRGARILADAEVVLHDALVTPDRSFTFAELREEVRRTAAAIAGLGVRPGDRVAIWSVAMETKLAVVIAAAPAGVMPFNSSNSTASPAV